MPSLGGGGHQPVEVGQGAEIGVDGGVAAGGAADGPGAARVVGPRCADPVRTFAGRDPDGVDGWKVENVEAEPRHVRQPDLDVGQGAGAGGVGGGGAGEELVPAAEAGPGPLHLDRVGLGGGGRPQVGVAGHELPQLRVGGQLEAVGILEALGEGDEPSTVGPLGPGRRLADQVGADEELDGEGLVGAGSDPEIPAPAAEAVNGGPNAEPVAAGPRHRELTPPAVVADGLEGSGSPPGLLLVAEADLGLELVGAVGEDIGLHGDGFTDRSLGRVAAAVDDGPHPGDDGPGPAEGLGGGGGRLRHRGGRCGGRPGPCTRPPCVGW